MNQSYIGLPFENRLSTYSQLSYTLKFIAQKSPKRYLKKMGFNYKESRKCGFSLVYYIYCTDLSYCCLIIYLVK